MNHMRLPVKRVQQVSKRLSLSHLSRSSVVAQNSNRRFSFAPAVDALDDNDVVKQLLKKMISGRREMDDMQTKRIDDADLERRFRHFQNVCDEAELCLVDLKEAGDNFQEECECATAAVESAFSAYVDLLEDLRRTRDEQLRFYTDERLQNANKLRTLREELDRVVKRL